MVTLAPKGCMILRPSLLAVTRACNADHHIYRPAWRAHMWITPHGLEYRSAVDHRNDR